MQVSDILTVFELKEWSKLSVAYLRVLTQRQQIPHVRVGRRVLYRAQDIEHWLKTKREGGGKQDIHSK